MPGHFAGQFGVLFFHLRLDERVAGLIHDRVAAQALQLVVEHLRALHFPDEGGAWFPRQDLAAVDQQQHVAVNDLTVFIHRADAVRVAVKGNAQVGVLPLHGVLQRFEIRGNGGVRMMIGKAAVHVEE